MFYRTFYRTLFITVLAIITALYATETPPPWKLVELLIEEYPFVVALVNRTKGYSCTGTIIGKQTILTSGYCTEPKPVYVVAGLPVIKSAIFTKSPKTLLRVAYTTVHRDYTFVKKPAEPNITRMHSNIGLVFVVRPLLAEYLPIAPIGKHYPTDINSKEPLKSVGFGQNYDNVFTLQLQNYDQIPCSNPRWYNCICGEDVQSVLPTHGAEFGGGAPVISGNQVIGITSGYPSGLLIMKSNEGQTVNIFTVIGPYIPWIDETVENTSKTVLKRITDNFLRSNSYNGLSKLHFIYISYALLCIKLCS